MPRRYAILDDNQRKLEIQLDALAREIPRLVAGRIRAAMVIGSVAEGLARDRSDVDLLLVLQDGTPRRQDYRWWEENVGSNLGPAAAGPFPVQPVIVGPSALATTEPHLRAAIRGGLALWDPEGVFDDQSEARA